MRLPRTSGILLHPSSLPGPHGSGDCGAAAYHFVDWLVAAGQSLWQILPLNGIGAGNSPYASNSAFAGNLLFVDLLELQSQGWLLHSEIEPVAGLLETHVDYAVVHPYRMQRLALAAQRFLALPAQHDRQIEFAAFCARHEHWLDDYALFMALSETLAAPDWCTWPRPLAQRDAVALTEARQVHAERMRFWKFGQWCFFRQWLKLKAYANQRGVQIVGDMPIFIGHHSAEVWAHQSLFELGPDGRPTVVAGVPPDFFSATGQRWGNPLYRWRRHARDGYAWWVRRMRLCFELVDCVRLDHFRGFAAHWEIPANEPTAVKGQWRNGPGADLFKAINAALGPMPIIAEDLGLITPDVEVLRKRFHFPGMRILQFAFGGEATNTYLPHHHEPDSVVYPGTHDNDTCVGWWATASEAERRYASAYLGSDGQGIAGAMVRAALGSVADTAIVAMQDVLALPGDCRMNRPGDGAGWWQWRMRWQQVEPKHAEGLARMCRLFDRDPRHRPQTAGTTA